MTRETVLNTLRTGLMGLLLFIFTLVVARQAKRRMDRTSYLRHRDPAVSELASNLVYVGILVLGVSLTLTSVFRTSVGTIITALGISGLAVSLALQDVLRNFVAGIYILLEKPYTIGDNISLREFTGEIRDVELRTTVLLTSSGAEVIVPNSVLMTDIVTNQSPGRLQGYTVDICGGTNLAEDGPKLVWEVLNVGNSISAEPPPEVFIESLDKESVTLRLRFSVAKGSSGVWEVVNELRQRLPDSSVTAKAE